MRLLLFAALFCSTAIAAIASPGDAVLLRYTASPGDSSAYDMLLNTGMAVQGMMSGAGITLQSVFTVHVKDSTEPQLGLDVDVVAMKASTHGAPGMRDTTINLISGSDMRLRVIIDRRGNILFAWPSAELVKAYQTGGHLAGGGIQNSLRKILLTYPTDPVRPGSTWQLTTVDTASMGRGNGIVTTIMSTLTYTGIADTLGAHCARISIASDSIGVVGQGDYQSSNLSVRGSGHMTGMYYIDVNSGLPVAGDMQSNIDMIFSPSGPADAPDNNSEPVHMYNTSDFVLRRKDTAR